MNWLKKIRSHLLYRYIFSYLGIFLIPFILMSFVVYNNSVTELRKEIEQSNIGKLQQAASVTNERMKDLENIASRISLDARLTPYMVKHDFYGNEAINELKKYKANSSIIEEVFLFYPDNNNIIYSSSGLYTLDALLDKKYQFADEGKSEIKEELYGRVPKVIPLNNAIAEKNGHERVIAVLYPVSLNNPHPYGTVMYFVNESVLTNLTQNILGNFQGNTYILGQNNEIISSTLNDEEIPPEDLRKAVQKNKGTDQIKLNNKEYSVLSVESGYNDWTFMTLIDTKQFFERVFHKKTIIIMVLFSLFLAGTVLAILLARKQYQPIKNIADMTNRKEMQNEVIQQSNELERIRTTISNVFESYDTLNETISLHKPFARDQLFIKLLRGDLQGIAHIDELLGSLNINMLSGGYFVAIAHFNEGADSENDMKEREKMIDFLPELPLMDSTVHGVDLLYEDAIVLIVSLKQDLHDLNTYRKERTVQIQSFIHDTVSVPITIGVGGLIDSKENIHRSYIEAIATMEYSFSVPKDSIIYFEEIGSKQEGELGYPQEEQLKFIHSVKQGNQAVADESLRTMFDDLSKSKASASASQVKCISFDIINVLVKTASELDVMEHVGDLKEIVNFTSLEQLENQLRKVTKQICGKVDANKKHHNNSMREEVQMYIQKNYNQYNLSLENIANAFQLSTPYLSKFIKEQFGISFTQYVFQLRLKEAKRQLRETNKLIKDIVLDVGYQDVSNFTREFRKAEGVTPGKYRKLNKK